MKFLPIDRMALLLVTLTTLLFACGGGGSTGQSGPLLVSGVAATGLPISGTVTLKDKNGILQGPTATDAEGNFSFDVKDLNAPFILKAEWTSGSQSNALYSVAIKAGTVHINPLSNLALMLATGTDPSAVFGAPGTKPDTAMLTQASVAASVEQLKTMLSPLLDDYGITDFDPLAGKYTARPDNKLDALLDVIGIKAEKGTVQVINKLDGAVIASGSAAKLEEILLDKSKSPAREVLTDIRELTDRVAALGAAMSLGASLTAGALEDFFVTDPNYGTSSGLTRAQDLASIEAIFSPGNSNKNGKLKTIRNVRLVSDQTAKYVGRGVSKVYVLNYDFIFENGVLEAGHNVTFGKETASGSWKFIGDPPNSTAGNNYGGVSITGRYLTPGSLTGGNYGWTVDAGGVSGSLTGTWSNHGGAGTLTGMFDSIKFGTDNVSNDTWQVVKNGNVVEISYKIQGVFAKYAEFDTDNSALRLRYSADSAWSPSMILKPLFSGDNTAYQGAPVMSNWGIGDFAELYYGWADGTSTGVGGIRFNPPENNIFTASVTIMGSIPPSMNTGRFLLQSLISEAIPVDQSTNQSISIDTLNINLPPDGWFLQPPVTGQVLTLYGWMSDSNTGWPTVVASFNQAVTISGVVDNSDDRNSVIRLNVESDQFYKEIGMASSGYTISVKP